MNEVIKKVQNFMRDSDYLQKWGSVALTDISMRQCWLLMKLYVDGPDYVSKLGKLGVIGVRQIQRLVEEGVYVEGKSLKPIPGRPGPRMSNGVKLTPKGRAIAKKLLPKDRSE